MATLHFQWNYSRWGGACSEIIIIIIIIVIIVCIIVIIVSIMIIIVIIVSITIIFIFITIITTHPVTIQIEWWRGEEAVQTDDQNIEVTIDQNKYDTNMIRISVMSIQ